jgi:hypothetical protein
MSNDALALISPCLNTINHYAYATIREPYEHLNKLYGDLNKKKNACHAFKELTMRKKQIFQEFYAMFLCYIADGNISPHDLKDDLNDKLIWKLQKAVTTYYNDPTITLSQFTWDCTTNDQQIRSQFKKCEQVIREINETRKSTLKQAQLP